MKTSQSSYKQIVKSTGIYGSSQLINIVLGVVRSKLTAIFLGTTGIGIIGLLQSVIDLSRASTSMGLEASATQKIATTSLTNATEAQKTLYTVNVWYLFTALLGAAVCIIFAKPLSIWAFENDEFTLHIVGLSIAVLLITLTAGIVSSLQGLRKISFMALSSSIGSFLSLFVMIPIYYYWGIEGIVPTYILTNLVMFLVGTYFYRKIEIRPVRVPLKEVVHRGKGMLVLGLFLVLSGILSTVSLLLVRTHINKEDGLDAVGLFQAAWIITALMWGIVIRSTNAEFFPKLCAIIDNKEESKRFVNEQTYIVLLIISPIIICLVTFSEYVLQILYTKDFITAAGTLRWHIVGAFFKIAATPIATIMLAKHKGRVHLFCETIFWGTYLLVFYMLFPLMHLQATGAAYLVGYLIYIPTVLAASYRVSGIVWNSSIVFMIVVNIFFIALIYVVIHFHYAHSLYLGSGILLLSLLYSLWKLRAVMKLEIVLRWFKNKGHKS